MNICHQGIIGKIVELSQPAIVKGSDGFIVTQVAYKGECDPAKIESFSGATGFLLNEDGTVYDFPATLESADLGELRFDLPASGTAGLKASEEASFEFALEDSRGLTFIQYDGKLQINDRLF